MLRGLRHGEGVFQCSDGVTSYTGQWHMGKRHGKVVCADTGSLLSVTVVCA